MITTPQAEKKGESPLGSDSCSRLLDHMMARHDMTENLYKKMEEHLPCDPMSDEMLAAMNKSLGFSGDAAKTRDYRPYCVREGCKDWPRMMRVKEGFRCWSCHGIWNLSSENVDVDASADEKTQPTKSNV